MCMNKGPIMFPNIAISLLGTLLPAIINSASPHQAVPDAVVRKAAASGVTVPNTISSLVGMIASTAIAVLGAAGFGDATHTAMMVFGGLGAVATALGHYGAIGASDNNTLSYIGALLTQLSQLQAENAALGGSLGGNTASLSALSAGTAPDVVLTAEPVRAAPMPSDASPIGAIS